MKTNEIGFYTLEHHFWSNICKDAIEIDSATFAYFSELPIPAFSFIYLKAGASIAHFEQANTLFSQQNKPYILVIHEDELEQFTPLISTKQYESDGETTAMVLIQAEMTHHTDYILPEGYKITLCNDQLEDWAAPLITAFGEETNDDNSDDKAVVDEYMRYHQRALDRNTQLQHYVLFNGNKPVSTLTLTVNGNMARLDDIGTDTQYQRKGLATLLIKHALKECMNNGIECCYLEASSDGLSIYKKLGFTALFNYHSFIVE
ncbi:GNAT family N-acetyltransferase [Providencia burhodogranariea]|uniref:Acetyltransferase n=1 Tax=Providencia burhodogranariea DSM 19968 TaxID=1141662 RepID=K8X065_9GAMM|nr:GNAT family N-acetyltransferase [Providencia burhodogranariea]EKT63022.1 acetyltransferase [Providencia burhodogranariea DSM 19968]